MFPTKKDLGVFDALLSLSTRQTMQHVLRAGAEGSPQTNPIIARIERKSGHGCGRSTQKIVRSGARPALVKN